MRLLLIILFCGFFILTVFIDQKASLPIQQNIKRKQAAGKDANRYHGKFFQVTYIVDGDTFDIKAPDKDKKTTRIRLLGIDTPETKNTRTGLMYFGPEATNEMKRLVEGKKVKVVIDTVSKSRDRYGRLLAYIHLEDGQDVNCLMIERGFAYADLRFAHSRFNEYNLAMNIAVENQTGLWQNVNPEQLPRWLIREMPEIEEILKKTENSTLSK